MVQNYPTDRKKKTVTRAQRSLRNIAANYKYAFSLFLFPQNEFIVQLTFKGKII